MRGSYPWVSGVLKCQNNFILHRFRISHTGKSIYTTPLWDFTYQDFAYRDFATCEDKGFIPLGFPKHRNHFTLHCFRISHTGKSIHTTPLRDFTYREINSHYTASGFHIMGFCVLGFRNLRRRGVHTLGFPGCRNAEIISHYTASGFHIPGN
jgi:hypothetical protein